MRFQGLLAFLVALFATLATPAMADETYGPLNPHIIPGIVLSLGRTDSTHNGTGVGSGVFADANYTRTFLNGGGEYEQYGNVRVANAFLGVGFSRLVQLQTGYGNNGVVQRLRSDFNFSSIMEFFSGTSYNRYDRTIGQRFTFTVSTETYGRQPRLDCFHLGFGLLY